MINHVSKSEIEELYKSDQDAFIKNVLSDKEFIVVSKMPIEIDDVRFRISLYYTENNLIKVTLVAVEKQNSEHYIGKTSREIHEAWLKSWAGSPHSSELYGIRYELDNTSIISEHDPRSDSDVIIVKYLEQNERRLFKNSRSVSDSLIKDLIGGAKVPHSTSYPVVYFEDGRYYLACFAFFYTRDDIESGKVDRPTIWAIADIENGEIIERIQTKENDFSDASHDIKYDIHSNKEYDTSREYYEKAFDILDSVRERILTEGILDKVEYAKYIDMILANIPEGYKRFYLDLSVDYLDKNDGDNVNDEGDDDTVNENEQLQELLDAIQKLQKCFDDKIAQDEHKNSLFDNMHRELIKYQNGAIDKKIDAMAMDIIMLNDNVKKVIGQNTDVEVSEDAFKKLIRQLRGISEELEDILYRENIEPFSVVGDDVDVKKQKIIGTVETNDESLNNKVAERGVEGYEKEDRVLRRENVRIYKYVNNTQEETPEEQSEEQLKEQNEEE